MKLEISLRTSDPVFGYGCNIAARGRLSCHPKGGLQRPRDLVLGSRQMPQHQAKSIGLGYIPLLRDTTPANHDTQYRCNHIDWFAGRRHIILVIGWFGIVGIVGWWLAKNLGLVHNAPALMPSSWDPIGELQRPRVTPWLKSNSFGQADVNGRERSRSGWAKRSRDGGERGSWEVDRGRVRGGGGGVGGSGEWGRGGVSVTAWCGLRVEKGCWV